MLNDSNTGRAAATKGLYARVEVKGQFLPGESDGSHPSLPTIEANGLSFEVSFGAAPVPPEKLESLSHRIVLAGEPSASVPTHRGRTTLS